MLPTAPIKSNKLQRRLVKEKNPIRYDFRQKWVYKQLFHRIEFRKVSAPTSKGHFFSLFGPSPCREIPRNTVKYVFIGGNQRKVLKYIASKIFLTNITSRSKHNTWKRKCRNGKAELEENYCECRYEFTTFEYLTARTISVGGAQRYVLKCCEMSLEQRIGIRWEGIHLCTDRMPQRLQKFEFYFTPISFHNKYIYALVINQRG